MILLEVEKMEEKSSSLYQLLIDLHYGRVLRRFEREDLFRDPTHDLSQTVSEDNMSHDRRLAHRSTLWIEVFHEVRVVEVGGRFGVVGGRGDEGWTTDEKGRRSVRNA